MLLNQVRGTKSLFWEISHQIQPFRKCLEDKVIPKSLETLAKTFWIVITQVLRGGNDWKYKVELVSTISVAAIDSVARYDTRAPDKEQ